MYDISHHTVLVVTQVAALLILAWIFSAAHRSRMNRRHEISKRILEKMNSEEFLEVLQSPDGRQSMERLLGTGRSPDEWVTDAIRRAILLLFAGPGLLIVFFFGDFSGHEMFFVLGCLSIAVGLGYLVAGALTRGRAGRSRPDGP